jgi:cadmium resistance protein CadD (predicted permease)
VSALLRHAVAHQRHVCPPDFLQQNSNEQGFYALNITIGQYVGFTTIIVISMIGFGVTLIMPSEPISFLGLPPILLRVRKSSRSR